MRLCRQVQLRTHNEVRSALGLESAPSAFCDSDVADLLSERRDTDFSCEPAVLDVLYGLIKTRQPRTIVEVGTYRGVSARVMCAALQSNGGGRIYTIDDGSQCADDGYAALLGTVIEDGWVVPIRKSSTDAFVAWGRARIDLLFLDGSHDFLSACVDFALWARYVSANGIIIIHDTHTRMERRFPEDYIFPLECFDVLNIQYVEEWVGGHEWEGCAFVAREGLLHANS